MLAYQSVKLRDACRVGRLLSRLGRCVRGVTAIEFAFAAPVLAATVAGVFELAMVMFVSTLAEGGLREASRFAITGYAPAGTTREERILQILGDHTIGLVDIEAADVTYKVYPSFGDVGKPEPFTDSSPANGVYDAGETFQDINGNGQWDADMGAAGLGGPGDIVLYTIEFDWALLTPLVAPLMGDGGKLRLTSSVAVRNEPFDVPPPPAGGS
ncbi:MAG: TadE/TadG family type IV pilus assembly protein [Rhodospirillaceae bacterium]